MGSRPSSANLLRDVEQPPAAGGLTLNSRFECVALHCSLSVRCCLVRQAVSRRQRTLQLSRGQGGDHPACTDRCAQGAGIRRLVGRAEDLHGSGPGARFKLRSVERTAVAAQVQARERLERLGLLDAVPTIDGTPDSDLDDGGSDLAFAEW